MKNPSLALHPDERVWLAEYRQALNERHPGVVVRMVVYGSKARGDAHEDSDIDVLLIVKNEAADLKLPLRRIGYRLSATSVRRAIDSGLYAGGVGQLQESNLLKHVWAGVAPIRCRRSRETAWR